MILVLVFYAGLVVGFVVCALLNERETARGLADEVEAWLMGGIDE